MRRDDRFNDAQSFAVFFLTLCLIVTTSIIIGGLLAAASIMAGALCAFVYDRLRT
jgi:xanthine/uracil permease